MFRLSYNPLPFPSESVVSWQREATLEEVSSSSLISQSPLFYTIRFSRPGSAFLFAACGSANTGGSSSGGGGTTGGNNGKGCKKIGVLLPETATSARWDSKDKPLLTQKIQAAVPGATVDYNNAGGNADDQQNQADAALTQGDCILVLAPVAGQKATIIVTKPKQS